MNLLLLEPSEVGENSSRVWLFDRRAHHLVSVLGVAPGRQVRVGVTDGRLGRAEVIQTGAEAVALELDLTERAPLPPETSLILALPRPKVLSRVLQNAAAMGVHRIHLVNAWRVEKSYFKSPRLLPSALKADLWRGAEQGGTPWLPRVEVHPLFVPFVERHLADVQTTSRELRLVAHPVALAGVEQVVLGEPEQPVAVAVGPEGGFIDLEIESLAAHGFMPVRLGARVLRVEAAVVAALSQLDLLRRLRGRNALSPQAHVS